MWTNVLECATGTHVYLARVIRLNYESHTCRLVEYDLPPRTDVLHEGTKGGGKLVIAMVGLPSRGKSYTANKLARYLCWLHYNAKVFNYGKYRRQMLGAKMPSAFYDPDNREGNELRDRMAQVGEGLVSKFLSCRCLLAFPPFLLHIDRRRWTI